MPQLSCLIPLCRSRQFLPWIEENIDSHLELGAEVIVSDRHMLDDTAALLRQRYTGVSAVRILTATDQADWVANINTLIAASRGDFFRIVPHDDTATADSTAHLIKALEREGDAIVASGTVKALDLDGKHLPQRDENNAGERAGRQGWTLDDALSLFWIGRFAGAFKGVFRARPVRRARLLIQPTRTLVSSERAALFGIALLGRFTFVPGSVLIKRYHDKSVHRGWQYTGQTTLDSAVVMRQYVADRLDDLAKRDRCDHNIFVNAHRWARWYDHRDGPAPGYLTLAETDALPPENKPGTN